MNLNLPCLKINRNTKKELCPENAKKIKMEENCEVIRELQKKLRNLKVKAQKGAAKNM